MRIDSNIASIARNEQLLAKSAHNVAKASATALSQDNPKRSQGASVDLAKEISGMIVAQRGSELDAVSVRTQDDMLGTLLDIKS